MESIKYKVIKTSAQYATYCRQLETLIEKGRQTKVIKDEIELLTLLIEKYEEGVNDLKDADPVQLLKGLLKENKMKAVDLARLLNVSEGLISDMLHYKKGFSKETIRILSERFSLSQEAFNRPYQLLNLAKLPKKNSRLRKNLFLTKAVKA